MTSVTGRSSQNYSLHTTCSDTTMGTPSRPLMDIIFPVRTVAGTTVQKHPVYILQIDVHTVQMNWICRLWRYLMGGTISSEEDTVCNF